MNRAFVDTGAWYALLDKNDPDHARMAETFRAYRGRLVTSNFVFDEAVTLARYRLGWDIAQRLGEQLRDRFGDTIPNCHPSASVPAFSSSTPGPVIFPLSR